MQMVDVLLESSGLLIKTARSVWPSGRVSV